MEERKLQDEESWKEYFSKIAELQKSSNRVIKVHQKLEEAIVNVKLSDVFSSETLKKIMLGGLVKENFSENGLAPFYQKLYGVSFDPGELVARLKAGVDLEEASKGLYGKVEKPEFIKLTERVSGALDETLFVAKNSFELPSLGIEEADLHDPYIGQKAAEAFLRDSLEISLNSNQ
jgi:hypothetical protein